MTNEPLRSDLSGHALLDDLFPEAPAVNDWTRATVSRYFSGTAFSGRRFERLLQGDRNTFDASDLIAVSMLGVNVPGDAAIEVLETRSEELSATLAQVPHDAIHQVEWAELGPGSAADTLWHQLHDIAGLGPTLIGKLMARKRPRLIPVYDERVHHRMGAPDGWWRFHWDWWSSGGHVERVAQLRDAVTGIGDISLLRVWDVAVWSYDRERRPLTR